MEIYFSDTNGFQFKEFHGDQIPVSAINISQEEYNMLLEGQSLGKTIVLGDNGRPILVSGPSLPLEEAIKLKLQQLNVKYEEKVFSLSPGVSPFEINTWVNQKAEAQLYLSDPNQPTPLLSAIAHEREMDIFSLATKILEKAHAHATEQGRLLGKRQVLEKAILAATSVKNLELVKWDNEDIAHATTPMVEMSAPMINMGSVQDNSNVLFNAILSNSSLGSQLQSVL